MNSRFNLGLRPATASSHSLFNRQADGIERNASASPDRFTLGTLLVPADASHSSLFARFLRQQRKIRALVFQSLAHAFSLFADERHAISLLFNHFHTLCKKYPGQPPPRQNTPISQPRLGRRRVPERSAPTRTRQGNSIWSLVAMSLFRHIVTSLLSAEKPYPTPYHLMAKRYRTHPRSEGVYSGFRVCLRCPGLKWSPGFRVCTCKP
jgi:hypothetical protein